MTLKTYISDHMSLTAEFDPRECAVSDVRMFFNDIDVTDIVGDEAIEAIEEKHCIVWPYLYQEQTGKTPSVHALNPHA